MSVNEDGPYTGKTYPPWVFNGGVMFGGCWTPGIGPGSGGVTFGPWAAELPPDGVGLGFGAGVVGVGGGGAAWAATSA